MAKVEPGPPIRVIVRVDLQLMYAETERELEALGLLPLKRSKEKCDGKMKMNAQCDVMQIYVSLVTTDWVRKAALRLGFSGFYQRYVACWNGSSSRYSNIHLVCPWD